MLIVITSWFGRCDFVSWKSSSSGLVASDRAVRTCDVVGRACRPNSVSAFTGVSRARRFGFGARDGRDPRDAATAHRAGSARPRPRARATPPQPAVFRRVTHIRAPSYRVGASTRLTQYPSFDRGATSLPPPRPPTRALPATHNDYVPTINVAAANYGFSPSFSTTRTIYFRSERRASLFFIFLLKTPGDSPFRYRTHAAF